MQKTWQLISCLRVIGQIPISVQIYKINNNIDYVFGEKTDKQNRSIT